jgi:hypothetical protein
MVELNKSFILFLSTREKSRPTSRVAIQAWQRLFLDAFSRPSSWVPNSKRAALSSHSLLDLGFLLYFPISILSSRLGLFGFSFFFFFFIFASFFRFIPFCCSARSSHPVGTHSLHSLSLLSPLLVP